MHVFFSSDIQGNQVRPGPGESRHAIHVLRMKAGDKALILDGRGNTYTAVLSEPNAKACLFEITHLQTHPRRKLQVHIAIAPTKMNDRMEWFLEKATEVGVEEITPVICERSERRLVNEERFEKMLMAACKQSMQPWFPVLHPALPLPDFLSKKDPGFIAHCASSLPRIPLFDALPGSGSVCILIGPEGDFTPAEIDQATSLGWKPVSLGQGRLRTETAGLVACVMASLRMR